LPSHGVRHLLFDVLDPSVTFDISKGLTPNELFFSNIMEGTSYILMKYDDNDVCFVLDQHAVLG
jgi:hypothetical protein